MPLLVVPGSIPTRRPVRTSRRQVRISAVLMAVPLLVGCAAAETSATETSGLVTYPLPENWAGDAGLKIGALVFVDGCVRFEDGDIPVFPDKLTTWDGTTLTFAGEEYRMGDEISLGGGSPVEGATVSIPIPKSCGNGIIIIVSPPSRAER